MILLKRTPGCRANLHPGFISVIVNGSTQFFFSEYSKFNKDSESEKIFEKYSSLSEINAINVFQKQHPACTPVFLVRTPTIFFQNLIEEVTSYLATPRKYGLYHF